MYTTSLKKEKVTSSPKGKTINTPHGEQWKNTTAAAENSYCTLLDVLILQYPNQWRRN